MVKSFLGTYTVLPQVLQGGIIHVTDTVLVPPAKQKRDICIAFLVLLSAGA